MTIGRDPSRTTRSASQSSIRSERHRLAVHPVISAAWDLVCDHARHGRTRSPEMQPDQLGLSHYVGARLRNVAGYSVAGEPVWQVRPGVEQYDHGVDLDFDGSILGVSWIIRRGVLSLEAGPLSVSHRLHEFRRLPSGAESMWSTVIGRRLASLRWSDRLECALEFEFGDITVTIAAAEWDPDLVPAIRPCSDGILVLFGPDWSRASPSGCS